MKRYDAIQNNGKNVYDDVFDAFVLGLRVTINESLKSSRAVFIDHNNVLINAMSFGSEFTRLEKQARLVGIYDKHFSRDVLYHDLINVLRQSKQAA